jgi:ankyrin repeat protein
MSLEADYLGAFEVHSPEEIKQALARGASATTLIKGRPPIEHFIEGYLRSPQFAPCLQILLDAGASIDDPLLKAILLDDPAAVERLLKAGDEPNRKFRISSAFTSCDGVTALHICAEFNSIKCARVLLQLGADVNARADVDKDGFGGQTPIFHAVNSIFNYCRPTMELLVEAGADLDVRLKGLIWGPGADWETLLLDVTPISYAQCGLYTQFQRREHDVYSNLSYLYQKRYASQLALRNVPNRYLAKP